MTSPTGRMIFALFCVLGIIVLAGGLLFEVGRQKRAANGAGIPTLVSPRQFRVRVVSALVWMSVLGLFAYAMMFLWPTAGKTPEGAAQAQRFILTTGVAVTLVCIGIMLLCYDIIVLMRAQREQTIQSYKNLAEMVRAEAERHTGENISGADIQPEKGKTL